MALIFIIGFCLWIWLEISTFVEIGGEIGVLLTLIGIFVTGAIGIWLLRTQGRVVMASLQKQVARGEAPLASIADSLSLLLGAVLMLIPGYVSDAMGLMMFVPGIRTLVGTMLMKNVGKAGRFGFMGKGPMGAKAGFGPSGFGPGGFEPGGFEPGSFNRNGFNRHDHDHQGNHPDARDDTIEGEFEERDDASTGGRRSLNEK